MFEKYTEFVLEDSEANKFFTLILNEPSNSKVRKMSTRCIRFSETVFDLGKPKSTSSLLKPLFSSHCSTVYILSGISILKKFL
ncbi:hypothetical protein DLM78_16170 [Leptospira stimsonii]|uniref:Uncharacterized protein n=1 Tax=Leptospira stimsonii TaxID=2202203 RepID=A0A8B3CNX3_9LEPT|nr:hypothetical protein DLM78_16170 [Leptospira stimsonii]